MGKDLFQNPGESLIKDEGEAIDKETREFYDRDADSYDSTRWTSLAGQYNNQVQTDLVRNLLPHTHGPLVEIGSGTGRFTSLLADQGDPLVLVDVAVGMLRKAHMRVATALPVLGDICRLPLPDDSMAGLVCLNVLSHVRHYGIALREIGRVLRPGGFALLNFNNLTSLYVLPGFIVNRRGRSFRARVYSQWIMWSSFRSALDAAGLRIEVSRGHLNLPTKVPKPLFHLLARIDRQVRNRARIAPYAFLLVVKAAQRSTLA